MSEWLAPTVCVLLFAAFSYAVGYLSFCKGVEMGKQLPTQGQLRRRPLTTKDTIALQVKAEGRCPECANLNDKHHPDCPLDPAKSKPRTGRRWKGFSALKRDLENKES